MPHGKNSKKIGKSQKQRENLFPNTHIHNRSLWHIYLIQTWWGCNWFYGSKSALLMKWRGHLVSVLHMWVNADYAHIYYCLFIYVVPTEIQLSRREGCDSIKLVTSATSLLVFFGWLMVKLKTGGELRCSRRVCSSCSITVDILEKRFGRTYEKILLHVCYCM